MYVDSDAYFVVDQERLKDSLKEALKTHPKKDEIIHLIVKMLDEDPQKRPPLKEVSNLAASFAL